MKLVELFSWSVTCKKSEHSPPKQPMPSVVSFGDSERSRLRASNTRFRRFRKHILGFNDVEHTIVYLVEAAKVLGVPIVITEQVPTKLGRSTKTILDAAGVGMHEGEVFIPPDVLLEEKTAFSMATPAVAEWLRARHIKRAVLVGAETHVCVAQTARDLAANGVSVDIVAEGVSSIRAFDRSTALARMAAQGAGGLTVTTAEAVVFDWLRDASHPAFKQVQALVKNYAEKARSHSLNSM